MLKLKYSHNICSVLINISSSECCRLGNTLCLCLPVLPAQAAPGRAPKSSAIDFAVEAFNCLQDLLSVFGIDCHMTCRGSSLDSNLNSAA